jgi:hypothetical protein
MLTDISVVRESRFLRRGMVMFFLLSAKWREAAAKGILEAEEVILASMKENS